MFLQQVTMKHYSNAECSQPSWYGSMIRDSMISFGHCVGGMGTCQGDSGGPLVCTDKDGTQWFLYGLTSWAKGGCASPNHPTIFTDVAKYVDWIHVNMVDMYNDEDYTWC
jgi:plasminogen